MLRSSASIEGLDSIQRHESTMPVELKSATASDSGRIAQLLIDARAAFIPYAPSAHTDEEVRSWVAASLVPSGDVILASANGATVGVMATKQECDCSWITQMVVDPAHVGHRIGSSLLAHALRVLQPPIRLYTFQANTGARRFYERYGFRAIRFTDGRANEENCPDVLYEFAATPNPVVRCQPASLIDGSTERFSPSIGKARDYHHAESCLRTFAHDFGLASSPRDASRRNHLQLRICRWALPKRTTNRRVRNSGLLAVPLCAIALHRGTAMP
jgi:ribosomal protein S18 acetylase RimI-like enzyme